MNLLANVRRGHVRPALFLAGVVAGVAAVGPPMDGLAHRSFAAHMAQHLVLMIAAPLLIVSSRPGAALLLALPPRIRRLLAPRATRLFALVPPLAVVAVHAIAMWAWHAPPPFEAALRSSSIHGLEHITLLGTALAFWTVLLRISRRSGAAALYAFGTAAHSGLLAALITFSAAPWYETYTRTSLPWGLSPSSDQQLAGVLMWVPAGIAYMGAGVVFFVRWLDRLERRSGPMRGERPRISSEERVRTAARSRGPTR